MIIPQGVDARGARPTICIAAGAMPGSRDDILRMARLLRRRATRSRRANSKFPPGRAARRARPAAARQAGAAAGDDPRRNAVDPRPGEARRGADLPPAGAPLPAEGSVLPDSYSYERGEAALGGPQADDRGDGQGARRVVGEARSRLSGGRRRSEAVILASIVEKETGKAAERRTVAGVYCNRLRIGMKLDADPTVIYPITKGKPLGRRIRRSELDAITGYNTYREVGLPDGPDRQSGHATASPRCSIRRRPRRSTSSPTAPAGMCSPTRWPSIMPMSPNGTRSAARAARCKLQRTRYSDRT